MGASTRIVVVQELEQFAQQLRQTGSELLDKCNNCSNLVGQLEDQLQGISISQNWEPLRQQLNTAATQIQDYMNQYADFVDKQVVSETVATEEAGAQQIQSATEDLAGSIK